MAACATYKPATTLQRRSTELAVGPPPRLRTACAAGAGCRSRSRRSAIGAGRRPISAKPNIDYTRANNLYSNPPALPSPITIRPKARLDSRKPRRSRRKPAIANARTVVDQASLTLERHLRARALRRLDHRAQRRSAEAWSATPPSASACRYPPGQSHLRRARYFAQKHSTGPAPDQSTSTPLQHPVGGIVTADLAASRSAKPCLLRRSHRSPIPRKKCVPA